jgi:transposase InsO family protein
MGLAYLPANVMGRWFRLYLILDLYSRKIVGAEVHDSDDARHAVHLVRRTARHPHPQGLYAVSCGTQRFHFFMARANG